MRAVPDAFLYQLSMMVRLSPHSPDDAEWYECLLTVKLYPALGTKGNFTAHSAEPSRALLVSYWWIVCRHVP